MSPLDEIKGRAEAATDGPWEYTGKDHQTTWIESPLEDVLIHDERGTGYMRENFSWIKQPDAEFIAHARTDVSKLVATLEAVLHLCNADSIDGYDLNDVRITIKQAFEGDSA